MQRRKVCGQGRGTLLPSQHARSSSSQAPSLIELRAPTEYAGEVSDVLFKGLWCESGDPAPPRSLHPYTNGERWEGTSIDSGTLTSDRIPCLGFDKVTVYFKADTAGDLTLNVDYGFDTLDEYDTVSVSADTLEKYTPTGEIPWLQLEYNPDSYTATVTRAKVVMR